MRTMTGATTHLDNRLLAFDRNPDPGFCQGHLHVAALDVCGNGRADIHVANGLRPFVGKLGLLGLLAGLALLLFVLASGQLGRRNVLLGAGGGHDDGRERRGEGGR